MASEMVRTRSNITAPCSPFLPVGACRNRALAPVKYFRGHRTRQQLIERVTMRRHYDWVGFFHLDCLQNYLGWVAIDQHASDGKAFQFKCKRVVQVFLGLSSHLREHIPSRELRVILRHLAVYHATPWDPVKLGQIEAERRVDHDVAALGRSTYTAP